MKENLAEVILGKQLEYMDKELANLNLACSQLTKELKSTEEKINNLIVDRLQVQTALNQLQETKCPVVTSSKKKGKK